MSTTLLIVFLLSVPNSIETQTLEFRNMEACQIAVSELQRDLSTLYVTGSVAAVTLSCVNKNAQ